MWLARLAAQTADYRSTMCIFFKVWQLRLTQKIQVSVRVKLLFKEYQIKEK